MKLYIAVSSEQSIRCQKYRKSHLKASTFFPSSKWKWLFPPNETQKYITTENTDGETEKKQRTSDNDRSPIKMLARMPTTNSVCVQQNVNVRLFFIPAIWSEVDFFPFMCTVFILVACSLFLLNRIEEIRSSE